MAIKKTALAFAGLLKYITAIFSKTLYGTEKLKLNDPLLHGVLDQLHAVAQVQLGH